MEKTIIKWQIVNTRKKDKNLPKAGSVIVFKLKGSDSLKAAFPDIKERISTSTVFQEDGNLFVTYNYIEIPFENGFVWCYLDDVEDVTD